MFVLKFLDYYTQTYLNQPQCYRKCMEFGLKGWKYFKIIKKQDIQALLRALSTTCFYHTDFPPIIMPLIISALKYLLQPLRNLYSLCHNVRKEVTSTRHQTELCVPCYNFFNTLSASQTIT